MASASKTPNLNLPQWVGTEKPERTDFNAAFDAIDDLAPVVTEIATLENGWVNLLSDQPLKCVKIGNIVFIYGEITRNDTSTASAIVTDLIPYTLKVARFTISSYYGYIQNNSIRFEVAVPAGRRTILLMSEISA